MILKEVCSWGYYLVRLATIPALDLLENVKVQAIIGPETPVEANFLTFLVDKAKVPILSFTTCPSLISAASPYFVQITQDERIQFKGLAIVVESFKWSDVILVHEDTDYGRETVPYIVDSFREKNIHVSYRSAISPSAGDDQILEELHKLLNKQITIFIVHVSPSLAFRLFVGAKRLGMMTEGYAWIITDKTMNLFDSMDSEVLESFQGALGFKPYIPASSEFRSFTRRWRKEYLFKNPAMELKELNMFNVWAYDAVWALAMAAEKVESGFSHAREKGEGSGVLDLTNIGVSKSGNVILNELLKITFKGLSGEFHLVNGKLITKPLEIVNVIGKGERRVGFWTPNDGISKELNPYAKEAYPFYSNNSGLEAIIWPGGSMTAPKGWILRMSSGKKLRIGAPVKMGFKELINVEHDPQTNKTTTAGFCVDVFNAALEALPYEVSYEFIPFDQANGRPTSGTYNDLIYQVYLQNFDAVVGDITITANRSLYVDFTLPYTEIGVGAISRDDNQRSMWWFLKPLDTSLWLTIAVFFVFTGVVVWIFEHPINTEFQGSRAQQVGTVFWFSFSTLVFIYREKLLSNLSRFLVIVWVFIVLILTSSYNAALSSMLTVQQIQLASRGANIGYQAGSFVKGVIVNNTNFKDPTLQSYFSTKEYADALSRGSKNGGASAIVDEIPYIKLFLAEYGDGYAMIDYESTTNGFGFVFRKGSPLVSEISREIAILREEGKLVAMEKKWFKRDSSFMPLDSTATNPTILTLSNFHGLFFISLITSTLVLIIFFIPFLSERLHVLLYYIFLKLVHSFGLEIKI